MEKRPLMDPMLPSVDAVTDAAPENVAAGAFPTVTTELRGDSSENESLPPLSPGPDETPLKPCLARCARWRCKGVCFIQGATATGSPFSCDRGDKGEVEVEGVMTTWMGPTLRGWVLLWLSQYKS